MVPHQAHCSQLNRPNRGEILELHYFRIHPREAAAASPNAASILLLGAAATSFTLTIQ
jgi:hypothetical protein